ncbi:MAG: hypothetical protein PHQ05_09040 [Sterolibacterium sp.]|nr:hypothetical protein [Sterolibacterium sp.]
MTSPLAGAPSLTPRPPHRRRRLYVDSTIQRSLLVAMVVLEVTLVAAAIWFAYGHLIEVINANMYRMKVVQTGPTMMLFAKEGLWVLGVFAVANLVALMVAAGIWSRHENLVVQDLDLLTGKTKELDFSSDANILPKHEVLALTLTWREQERIRFSAIRDRVAKLEAALSSGEPPGDIQGMVDNLNRLLPQT